MDYKNKSKAGAGEGTLSISHNVKGPLRVRMPY